jgi:hypothetical protein
MQMLQFVAELLMEEVLLNQLLNLLTNGEVNAKYDYYYVEAGHS